MASAVVLKTASKAHGNNAVTTQQQKRLFQLFSALSASERETVLLFAEFLKARRGQEIPSILPHPRPLPRPPEESVVAAIKRLTASYPMLDRSTMLNDTSALMAQHVLQGRAASEIIDALEQVFCARYERLKAKSSQSES
jgi:hypothetical protein